jgi:UDP-glucose 4-epimerase
MVQREHLLVTGGAGYVGSHCVAALLENGHAVTVLDNLQQGHRACVPSAAEFVAGDLNDKALLDRVFAQRRYSGVLHFAANSLVGESMREPFKYIGDNVANAANLLRAALKAGVRKFVLSSTANLFGDPARVPIDEDVPIEPGSPYGESKLMVERMLLWTERTHGMKSACLRYFNAAGAHPDGRLGEDHDPETHLIPIVLDVALGKRKQIDVFGNDYQTPDGTCVRDYVHVCDLAEAHMLALGALDTRSVRYNLGNGKGYSVLEVIETARRVTGHAIPMQVAARRPGDPAVLVASSERIRAELGWQPRFAELEAIVASAWAWKKAHPRGYDDRL